MRFFHFGRAFALTALLFLLNVSFLRAQQQGKKYGTLLWEISGNGLSKPSYLFGTMHISNKMVFHLSDSFYYGIKNADVVAIELNPEQWQSEIPRINNQSLAYRQFYAPYYTDYLNQYSMTEGSYTEQVKAALRMEPALNDALLYRNQRGMDNFEEDTYLDLYIYQTGKKLGKEAAGVETYVGSQQMMIEAYIDMANEKNKPRQRSDINMYEVGQNLQDAYRRGDLDMLDSLNKLSETSASFSEKFLYKRNDMQADAMDSIMKKKSLFVGVGAAHLPGDRGVIEILRRKGYKLRPIYMQDRDAAQKDAIDSLRVPVAFATQFAADSLFSVSVPGKLNVSNEDNSGSMHYADMANGAYYVVSRIKTNILFNGYDSERSLRSVDSLLYENIPGRILTKEKIVRDGFAGWDVVNRTRKGDIQRYNIIVMPSEIVVFKMGGKGNYVYGKEAETFFKSIAFKTKSNQNSVVNYSPAYGGFKVELPSEPVTFYTRQSTDNLPAWKYEALDAKTGDVYTIFKKNIYSYNFSAADTFDLRLLEESYANDKSVDKKIAESLRSYNSKPVLDGHYKLKSGDYVKVRFVLNGPHYYMLALRSKEKNRDATAYFNSFVQVPYKYDNAKEYRDSLLNYKVTTSLNPAMDADVMGMLMYAQKNSPQKRDTVNYESGPTNNFSNFISEKTGEVIILNSYKYPEYYFLKDSTKFWREELQYDSVMVVTRKQPINKGDGTTGWLLYAADTASSRVIKYQIMMRGMNVLTAFTMVDTNVAESSFVTEFYNTLDFLDAPASPTLFDSKVALFDRNFHSTDTMVSKRAKNALANVYYGKEGLPVIKKLMSELNSKDKDYYELKSKLIAELGYINDSAVVKDVTGMLQDIYKSSGDTALFQNSVFSALARLRTREAASTFKELILLDPPVFEERYEYAQLLQPFADSLPLAKELYPDIMNLATIEDYKDPVRKLLAKLVDSNYIKSDAYESYVGNIYFDAKIMLKKMQAANEAARSVTPSEYAEYVEMDTTAGTMGYYTTLLMPFYDANPNLPRFFERLLQSPEQALKVNTALSMLKNNRPVNDTVWNSIAADNSYRNFLYTSLKRVGRSDLFPDKYKTADQLSESMVTFAFSNMQDSLQLIKKEPYEYNGNKGNLYAYKYKVKGNSNWYIAYNGIIQQKDKQITSTGDLLKVTRDKFSDSKPVAEQLDKGLKKIKIGMQPSGRAFYTEEEPGYTASSSYVN